MTHYILAPDGKTPILTDMLTWASWNETADRRVAYWKTKGISVSTVFLGLDHSFGDSEEPILFETMVFGGPHDGYTQRYSTFVEAINGHEHTISKVLNEEEWGE